MDGDAKVEDKEEEDVEDEVEVSYDDVVGV